MKPWTGNHDAHMFAYLTAPLTAFQFMTVIHSEIFSIMKNSWDGKSCTGMSCTSSRTLYGEGEVLSVMLFWRSSRPLETRQLKPEQYLWWNSSTGRQVPLTGDMCHKHVFHCERNPFLTHESHGRAVSFSVTVLCIGHHLCTLLRHLVYAYIVYTGD